MFIYSSPLHLHHQPVSGRSKAVAESNNQPVSPSRPQLSGGRGAEVAMMALNQRQLCQSLQVEQVDLDEASGGPSEISRAHGWMRQMNNMERRPMLNFGVG